MQNMGTEILREQYNLLIESQKQKIKKLQDKKLAKANSATNNSETNEIETKNLDKINDFDMFNYSSDDDLELETNALKFSKKPQPAAATAKSKLSSSTFLSDLELNPAKEASNNDKIREFRDESGRLRKLLAEKEYEINYLKKQLEEEKLAFTGGTIGSDAIATKIVDLSKRVRELNAELEMEKTKNKKLNKQCKDLELKVKNSNNKENHNNQNDDDDDDYENVEEKLNKEIKELKEKLNQTSGKMMEYKSQVDILKQDLKKHQRALEREVGENYDVKAILSGQSNWKGRHQQIKALQLKMNEMKQQIGLMDNTRTLDYGEGDMESFIKTADGYKSAEQMSLASFGTSRRSMLDSKHREEIKRIEKERKEHVEKVKKEYEAIEVDYNSIKSKFDAVKARNTVLTNEVKTSKDQIKTLLDKGKHDDELIQALLQKQEQMKQVIDELTIKNEAANKEVEEKLKEVQIKTMQEKNTVEQMKSIISERERRVKQLEDEIEALKLREHSQQQLQFILNSTRNTPTPAQQPVHVTFVDDNQSDYYDKQSANGGSRSNSRTELASAKAVQNRQTDRDVVPSRHTFRNGSSKINSRPSSGATNESNKINLSLKKELDELKLQYQELKTMNKGNDIERTRLMELVKILQKRLETMNEKLIESDNKYNEQRRRSANLEKQFERYKLDNNSGNNNNKNAKTKQTSTSSGMSTMDQYKLEELETSLLIQKDENDALKAALKSTLEAKEEDLRLYVEMLESTKRVFLDGLKEFKHLASK